jgi:hypothetical protein
LFSIHSTVSDRELIFSSRKGDYFHVELKSMEMSSSTEVCSYTDTNGLNTFFQDISGLNCPWQGEHTWGSLEGEFEISAICTSLGHIIFHVKLSGQFGSTEEWKTQFGLETELGQLETIARNAAMFFKQ